MPIATINPATGEVIKTFQPLSEAEIEKKLQLAVTVFKSERKTPYSVRAQRMRRAAEIMERDKDKFGHLMTLEMGKTLKSAIAEAAKCATACRYYAEHTEKILADVPEIPWRGSYGLPDLKYGPNFAKVIEDLRTARFRHLGWSLYRTLRNAADPANFPPD